MIDIDKIEAAAKAATPGKWEVTRWGSFPVDVKAMDDDDGYRSVCVRSDLATHPYADLAHIATSNPATVLEMVSMIRERDASIRLLREALSMIRGDERTCVQLDGHIKAALAATEAKP